MMQFKLERETNFRYCLKWWRKLHKKYLAVDSAWSEVVKAKRAGNVDALEKSAFTLSRYANALDRFVKVHNQELKSGNLVNNEEVEKEEEVEPVDGRKGFNP